MFGLVTKSCRRRSNIMKLDQSSHITFNVCVCWKLAGSMSERQNTQTRHFGCSLQSNSGDSNKAAIIRSFIWIFTVCLCYKAHNLISWLNMNTHVHNMLYHNVSIHTWPFVIAFNTNMNTCTITENTSFTPADYDIIRMETISRYTNLLVKNRYYF